MSSKFILVCEVPDDGPTVAGEIAPGVAGSPDTTGAGAWGSIERMGAYIQSMAHSGRGILISYADTAVSASTTGTFTGDPTTNDTITVNGVVFTAKTSGATGNQFNISVGSVSGNAANLAAAINASTTAGIINTVRATSALGVVTFYSVVPGPVGLNIPITESLGNFTLAQVTFTTGGTQSHNTTYQCGKNVPTAT